MKDIWHKVCELTEKKSPYCIVTLIDVRGSAPQNIGAKILVNTKGLIEGTIGGGKIEAFTINRAINFLGTKDKNIYIETYNLQKEIGMTCGGEVQLLFELFYFNVPKVVIFGAGHISQALTRVLSKLKIHLYCYDTRKEWIDRLDIPNKFVVENLADQVSKFDRDTYFISITMGHSHDVPVLYSIHKHFNHCRFVGVIGSLSKRNAIIKDLLALGATTHFCENLKIPIGLDIGTNDPEEISISIAAQLLNEFRL